jgi:integrase
MKEIKPTNNNGSILLRFSYNGQRYSFNPIKGGDYSNQNHLAKAITIGKQIKFDIESGEFDPSLIKYGWLKKIKPTLDLQKLWDKYRKFKEAFLSPSTLGVDLDRRVGNCFALLPSINIEDSIKIRDWLIENKTPSQAKRILVQLNACCNWGVESELISENPFQKINKKIIVKKSEDDINPFTLDERDTIIDAFRASKYYNFYLPLVQFVFYTGCRPSEVVALEWLDIKQNVIIFNKSYVERKKQFRLKTQKKRIIKVNLQVKEVIQLAKSSLPSQSLVFPSKEGKYLDWHNFCNRAWRKTLKSLPEIEYRNPYQMRHTFITLALQKGVPIVDLAKHCGNSPKIILDKYAGITRDFVMPLI